MSDLLAIEPLEGWSEEAIDRLWMLYEHELYGGQGLAGLIGIAVDLRTRELVPDVRAYEVERVALLLGIAPRGFYSGSIEHRKSRGWRGGRQWQAWEVRLLRKLRRANHGFVSCSYAMRRDTPEVKRMVKKLCL